ncbi:sugar kinase [Paenibacillus sp. Marseille-Q4541]|uniref:sugar kinase n=1 Tax=Paenibacillus sp. Marseille-Q4541 TaxID=2831522 RepID=UPI001BA91885|nr:sugar kinase [Paenibacillus sp. Marseille-Q4541]
MAKANLKQITSFGEVMMRLEVPSHLTLSQSRSLNYSFTGTGVNVVAALIKLGHQGAIVTTLPSNSLGDAAEASLRGLGFQMEYVRREGQLLGSYFLETGYGPRKSKVTYASRKNSSFNSASRDVYDHLPVAKESDYFHLCGIGLAMNEEIRYQMKTLAGEVKSQGGTVVFDCNFRASLWSEEEKKQAKHHYEDMLRLSDIVMMNERDAISLLGYEASSDDRLDQIKELIPRIAEDYHIRVISGTQRTIEADGHSIQGFLYRKETGGMTFGKPMRVQVLDRIGAGDAYTAGIIHGEICGYDPGYTVQYATAASVLAHTIIGDTALSSEEDILQVMNELVLDIER